MSMIGKTLARYEITSQLGKGGMGEVYQAKDQKLGREVAIKVLPEEFARDADRLARFQREAKLLASLNHPNIAAIYGLEESDQTNFLVLELVEGETLADRIKKGSIPVEEALKLALQIAEALEAAHEKGVIHRDLKPANIKVTPDGKVKVLDFGLAKAYAGDREELNLSNSPTLSDAATRQGVILGTAAYMSPEQARGKTVDKRTDIWAFGCVLFEMLAGQAAFQGEDVTEILAAVVKGIADLDLLPANLHPRVREVIIRCLQKEQKKRYPEIGEAHYEIEKVLSDPSGVFVQQATAVKPRKRARVGLEFIAAAIILTAIIAGLAVWYMKPPEPKRVIRLEYELPEGQEFSSLNRQHLAVSPDGDQFVFSTRTGLYLRSLERTTATHIAGTDRTSREPIFSPDGKWICFYSTSDSQLKKIAVSGGAPVTLCASQGPRRPTWSADGTIVYCQDEGIMRISSNGGTPELLVKAEGKTLGEPQVLPDGKAVLFSIRPGDSRRIAVQSLTSGERKELFAGDSARYSPTGHLIYALQNNLFAVPFDLGKLEVKGGSVPVVEGVLHTGASPHAQYAFSDSGLLVYTPGTIGATQPKRTLVWVDRKGQEAPLDATPDEYAFPTISPDGTRVALSVGNSADSDIWIWDIIHKNLTRLTFDPSAEAFPLWTPDGKRIAYSAINSDTLGVYWKASDGTGKSELLVSYPESWFFPSSWSNSGKSLMLGKIPNLDIGMLPMEGDRKWKPLLQEKYNECNPQISPNGRWMAYTSNETGKNEIYVRPFPEVDGGRWQISTSGGENPLWSPDGRELFYRNGDTIMASSTRTGPSFGHETPKLLFRGIYSSNSSNIGRTWDISPDGKRFLMLKDPAISSAGASPRKINIVLNWFEELKQRVPTK